MNTPKNLQELRALRATSATLSYRFFLDYQPTKGGPITNACLSQWWPCMFSVGTNTFTTAEHFMMYEKATLFHDHETAARILDADHPFKAKTLGRRVRNFDEARWDQARVNLVIRGNIAKFSQNPKLLTFLIVTGDAILAETSPSDLIWGIGCREEDPIAKQPENWPGLNLLGFALMQAREHLRMKTEREQTHLISNACH
jgi:ribA/ribD-fused uncharacterized protein